MADKTGIEWTDASWNPVVGCSIVSPGCTNCYAMKQAYRIEKMAAGAGRKSHYADTTQQSKAGAVWTGKVNLAPDHIITQPLRWKRPRRIFVNSMSDLFHEDVSDGWIDRIFTIMALCPQHTFQILTKRADGMRDYMKGLGNIAGFKRLEICARDMGYTFKFEGLPLVPFPIPNIWLGVSVEDQTRADERIPSLLSTPTAVRFLSCEPLLGPVDLTPYIQSLNWIICGGESGSGARPMHPDWAISLRDQCQDADVPFFFKQWGEWTPGVNVERDKGCVETALWFDERWLFDSENLACEDGHVDDEPDLYRMGKRAAGRYLDGKTWNEMPI